MANGGNEGGGPIGLMKYLAEGFKNHLLRPAIFIVVFLAVAVPLVLTYGEGNPALIAIGIPVALAFVLIVVMLDCGDLLTRFCRTDRTDLEVPHQLAVINGLA